MAEIAPIYVRAAGSLRGVLPQLCQAFAQHEGRSVDLHLGPTMRMREEVQKGAPCDLFISSDREQAQAAMESRPAAKLLDWVGTSMSLMVPQKGKAAQILPPEEESVVRDGLPGWLRLLASPNLVIGISNPDADPAGLYALQLIARTAHYGAQLPVTIQNHLKPLVGGCSKAVREDQKGANYLFTDFGCDVFLGYSHFARAAVRNNPGLRFIGIPPANNVGCRYVFTEFGEAALPLVEFLFSASSLATMSAAGFIIPEAN